jgi:hypothetical protein
VLVGDAHARDREHTCAGGRHRDSTTARRSRVAQRAVERSRHAPGPVIGARAPNVAACRSELMTKRCEPPRVPRRLHSVQEGWSHGTTEEILGFLPNRNGGMPSFLIHRSGRGHQRDPATGHCPSDIRPAHRIDRAAALASPLRTFDPFGDAIPTTLPATRPTLPPDAVSHCDAGRRLPPLGARLSGRQPDHFDARK